MVLFFFFLCIILKLCTICSNKHLLCVVLFFNFLKVKAAAKYVDVPVSTILLIYFFLVFIIIQKIGGLLAHIFYC